METHTEVSVSPCVRWPEKTLNFPVLDRVSVMTEPYDFLVKLEYYETILSSI